jgi:hypothetical protein
VGQNRLYCLGKGLPLPELGSLQYYMVSEQMQRERNEKIAFAKLLSGLLMPDSPEAAYKVRTYAEEVMQLTYNYDYKPIVQKVLEDKKRMRDEEERVLKKVAAMTVIDDKKQVSK